MPTRLAVIVMNIAEQVLLEEGDAKLHMAIEVVATRPYHLSLPASVMYCQYQSTRTVLMAFWVPT